MDHIGVLIEILLLLFKVSLASAGMPQSTESQIYRQFYTTQPLNQSSTQIVRGHLDCSSKCNSEPELACQGYSLVSRSDGYKDCILYDNLNSTFLSVSASPGAEVVYAIKGAGSTCPDGYDLNPYSDTCIRVISDVYRSWEDAKSNCESDGEYLLTLATSNSFNWFMSRPDIGMRNDLMWIGLSVTDSQWRWKGRSTSPLAVADPKWNQADQKRHDTSGVFCGTTPPIRHHHRLIGEPCTYTHASLCELVL